MCARAEEDADAAIRPEPERGDPRVASVHEDVRRSGGTEVSAETKGAESAAAATSNPHMHERATNAWPKQRRMQ